MIAPAPFVPVFVPVLVFVIVIVIVIVIVTEATPLGRETQLIRECANATLVLVLVHGRRVRIIELRSVCLIYSCGLRRASAPHSALGTPPSAFVLSVLVLQTLLGLLS